MSDLISRDEAIKRATADHDFYRGATSPTDKARRDELLNVMCWLNELSSAEPHWIPCSERLPEVRQWVLCQCRAGIMDVLRLTANGRWYKGYPSVEYMGGFVVAWMPLPKPYEGIGG